MICFDTMFFWHKYKCYLFEKLFLISCTSEEHGEKHGEKHGEELYINNITTHDLKFVKFCPNVCMLVVLVIKFGHRKVVACRKK